MILNINEAKREIYKLLPNRLSNAKIIDELCEIYCLDIDLNFSLINDSLCVIRDEKGKIVYSIEIKKDFIKVLKSRWKGSSKIIYEICFFENFIKTSYTERVCYIDGNDLKPCSYSKEQIINVYKSNYLIYDKKAMQEINLRNFKKTNEVTQIYINPDIEQAYMKKTELEGNNVKNKNMFCSYYQKRKFTKDDPTRLTGTIDAYSDVPKQIEFEKFMNYLDPEEKVQLELLKK